jgi:predicted phage tail protein
MNGPAEVLIPFGAFLMVSWIVYTVVNGIRLWYQQRTLSQFQTKLLDRIGSVNELGAFLNTEPGARFLKGLTTVNEAGRPHTRIVGALQSGAVLGTLGGALFLYSSWTTLSSGVTNAINAVATAFAGLGVGFLFAAGLSYWMSRQLGLLTPEEQRRDEPHVPTL